PEERGDRLVLGGGAALVAERNEERRLEALHGRGREQGELLGVDALATARQLLDDGDGHAGVRVLADLRAVGGPVDLEVVDHRQDHVVHRTLDGGAGRARVGRADDVELQTHQLHHLAALPEQRQGVEEEVDLPGRRVRRIGARGAFELVGDGERKPWIEHLCLVRALWLATYPTQAGGRASPNVAP